MKKQIMVYLGLGCVILFLLGIVIFEVFLKKDPITIVYSPTNSPLPPSFVISVSTKSLSLSTSTSIPSVLKYPTFTPIPSPTSFVLTPYKGSNNNGGGNPPSTNCSANLEYATAMHQYYLDTIDYIHQPMIDYYENLLKQLLESRDGGAMDRATKALNQEKAQIAAEKAAENKRYEAELAYIKANCG